MNLELQTRAFDLYISELDSYLGVHDSVEVDKKVSRTRSIDWEIKVYSIANAAIDEIRFSAKRVCFSLLWEIDLDSLEEYEALRLQKQHNATISDKTVFGQIIVNTSESNWKIDFNVQLSQSNSFSCKPETLWVYLDSKYIEVSCQD